MKDAPEAADIQVGANIRKLRAVRGMSQSELGERLDITFQQIQKYEKGMNRVSASKLVKIAEVFDVKIEVLFEGIDGAESGTAQALPSFDKEAVALAHDFEAISDQSVRLSIRNLVKSLGRQQVADAA